MTPAATGRPAYHPSTLLKIYLYGYDFKPIADFRKDNGAAIQLVCRQFIELCRRLKLSPVLLLLRSTAASSKQ